MILQKWKSLGVRFLAVNFLVAVVPLFVFLYFTVPRTQDTLADSLSASLKTKAIVAALGIDHFLEERVVEARVLSQADVLETDDVEARIQYLTEVVEATPWIADIDIVGIDGVTICSSGDQNEKGLLASDVLPGIGSVLRAAAKGHQGEVFVSEAIEIDSGTGLCFVTPITDDANIEVVSLLSIEVSLKAIEPLVNDFLKNLKAHGAKTVYLVDNDGRVVVGAGSSVATFETLPDLATQPDLLSKFERQGMVGSTIYTDSDGAEVVAGYADLGEFGKNEALDWSIISTVSLAEWSSGFTRTANQSIVFLLASSLIALGIGAAMSLSVVRRIGLLGKATETVGRGDLTIAIALKGDDELSYLSRDFNEMVARLRELEQDRMQAKEKLEQAVQEKTKEMEILTEHLLRAEKLATIGKISGSIAHELRNPLGAIKQSVFYLNRLHAKGRMDSTNVKVTDHLALIDTELQMSERVIVDLLEATRTKAPIREQINLQMITLEAVRRARLESRMQVQFKLKPDPLLIFADPIQFQQVMVNILTNSNQASPSASLVTVTASLLLADKQVRIQIQDNGPGIDSEALTQVFEPLFTTKAKGAGLGLSICKQVIENHNGTITLTSQVGQGTMVEILLPDNHPETM